MNEMLDFRDLAVSLSFFIGGIFILLAAIGLVRLPDLYCRMHAICSASTAAKIFCFGGAALYFYEDDPTIIFKAAFVLIFLFATMPVASHLIARAGYRRGAKPCVETWLDEYRR